MRLHTCLLLLVSSTLALPLQVSAQAPEAGAVAIVQILLDRAGFSPGEIDGRDGANTRRAVSAFARANSLEVTGGVDAALIEKLTSLEGVPPLVDYTITQEDTEGPFIRGIPRDLMEQSSLKALSYRNALEAIAERFHSSPAFLRQLNPNATFTQAGEKVWVPNVENVAMPVPPKEPKAARGRRGAGAPEPTGTSGVPAAENAVTIYVTQETGALTVEDSTGRLLFHAPVTMGSKHDPLPTGEWQVTNVQPNPVFNYNPDLFWDADPTHARARIAPGPNNPVGTVWIGLTKEHYGIHGTPEPSRIGVTQSHGCVRLTNWDIQRVAQWATRGTRVVFR
jgi:lipoprotein-anchoring transpeptidase ErfK/SrfK